MLTVVSSHIYVHPCSLQTTVLDHNEGFCYLTFLFAYEPPDKSFRGLFKRCWAPSLRASAFEITVAGEGCEDLDPFKFESGCTRVPKEIRRQGVLA